MEADTPFLCIITVPSMHHNCRVSGERNLSISCHWDTEARGCCWHICFCSCGAATLCTSVESGLMHKNVYSNDGIWGMEYSREPFLGAVDWWGHGDFSSLHLLCSLRRWKLLILGHDGAQGNITKCGSSLKHCRCGPGGATAQGGIKGLASRRRNWYTIIIASSRKLALDVICIAVAVLWRGNIFWDYPCC